MKIIALTTCHNRKRLTLRSLESLYAQSLTSEYTLKICLVDDGSSDGTAEEIRANFPEVVILHGTGNLFWAGGMRFGWEQFVSYQDFDYLIVFNDDINLYSTAISTLLQTAKIIENKGYTKYAVTGAFLDPNSNKTAYGGIIQNCWWHPLRSKKIEPSSTYQKCDTLNMNFALINATALNSIGFLSPHFRHKMADYDFGLRLRKAGGCLILASGYVGECSRNEQQKDLEAPILKQWQNFTGIKGQPPRERAIYYRRHGGFLWPVYWIIPYLFFLPRKLLYRLKNIKKS